MRRISERLDIHYSPKHGSWLNMAGIEIGVVAWQYLESRIPDLGEGFTGQSGRVGMAQDLANTGVELPALMTAGRWKSSKMPAAVHRAPGRRTGRGGQVLPGERGFAA